MLNIYFIQKEKNLLFIHLYDMYFIKIQCSINKTYKITSLINTFEKQ
jgi:hypothetical protein